MGRWLIVLLIACLVVTGCASPSANADVESQSKNADDFTSELSGAVLDPPRSIEDFEVESTVGEFRLSDYQGQIVLLYFGYMSCPDVCPATSATLQWTYEELGDQSEDVTVVFVTVDPQRDTVDRLGAYLGLFHEDFIGIYAQDDQLGSMMAQFGARAEKQQMSDSALGYLMDHTASIFLIAPDGSLLEQFIFGTTHEDIVHDIQIVLEAYEV
jgi:protein SCO1/2